MTEIILKHRVIKTELKSGPTLIQIAVPNNAISMVGLCFRAGSRFDPKGREGLAHLFEHLLVVQLPEEPGQMDKFRVLEKNGIFSNAETDYETAMYYNLQPADRTKISFQLLLKNIFNNSITPASLLKEKSVILNEAEQNFQDPENFLWRLNNQSLWPKSSLGRDLYGSKESIAKISFKDVQDFWRLNYDKKKFVCIVVAPKIDKSLPALLKGYLCGENNFAREIFVPPLKQNSNLRKIDQLTVGLGFKTGPIGNHREVAYSHLLRDYLANHWSARLVERLRIKEKVAYWVSGTTANFSDTGMIRFIYSCSSGNLNKTLKLFVEELDLLKQKTISKADLALTKNYYISSLIREFHDPCQLAWWYAWQEILTGKTIEVNDFIALVKSINATELKETAKKYFSRDNYSVTIIGRQRGKVYFNL